MQASELRPGQTVYHRIYTHLGPGIVKFVDLASGLEYLFERGSKRVVVKFEGDETDWRVHPSVLRKTPNKKKIREMVAMYARRGALAWDGGDRLIIPVEERSQ